MLAASSTTGAPSAALDPAAAVGVLTGGSPDAALESARVDSGVLGVGSLPEALAATLAGLEPGVSPAQAAVAVLVMVERLKAMLDAAGLAALALLQSAVAAECDALWTGSMTAREAADWRERMTRDGTVEEVKAATGLGEVECQRRLAFVTADPAATVTLRAGLRSGAVSLQRVLRVHDATCDRDPQVADEIAARVLAPCRDGSTPSQTLFASRLRRQLARHPVTDPIVARRDALAARDARGEVLIDGSGEMSISGDGQRVAAAVCRVDGLARAARASGRHGGRTLSQLRSDIALDLLLYGQPPGAASAGQGHPASARRAHAGHGIGACDGNHPGAGHSDSAGQAQLGQSRGGLDHDAAGAHFVGSATVPSGINAVGASGVPGSTGPSGTTALEPLAPVVGAYPPARVQLVVSLETLLGVTDGLGEIPGYGYVTAQQARDIAFTAGSTWRRLVTDPVTGTLLAQDSRSYTPPPRLRAHVSARDHSCRGPGCQIPATSCDLDHDHPWPAGPTSAGNLSAKHRRHHNLKTTGLWHAEHDPSDDTLSWRTLAGLTYTTHPHDYRELDNPPLAGPPATPGEPELLNALSESIDDRARATGPPADDPPPF